MRRLIPVVLAMAAAVLPATAESVRVGLLAGVELTSQPTYDDVFQAYQDPAAIIPGISWEVVRGNVGMGLTGIVDFDEVDATVAGRDSDWYLSWIGSFDLRYHILRRSLLDPFLEVGIGNAGRVLLGGGPPLNLSLFGQVGGGLALRLSSSYLGVRGLYRFRNSPVPATSFDVYPLAGFHVDLFVGLVM